MLENKNRGWPGFGVAIWMHPSEWQLHAYAFGRGSEFGDLGMGVTVGPLRVWLDWPWLGLKIRAKAE